MTTEEKPEIPTPVRVWGSNDDHLVPHRCKIHARVFKGFLTLLYDPQDLRICLRTGDKQQHTMRLPWAQLATAHELDGEAVAVHFDETTLDGDVVDRTVFALMDIHPSMVRDPAEVRRQVKEFNAKRGVKPMTFAQITQKLRDVFESDEEREAFAASIRERRDDPDPD